MKKILFILGTRPEAIKLAPLIERFKTVNDFNVRVCISGQHREMLDQVFSFFEIAADFDLNLMQRNQTPNSLISRLLDGLDPVFNEFLPELVIVQGDTSTALAGALAAFHRKIKIAHVEAGLRSFRKFEPFPEEMNRCLISKLADFHFAPTQSSYENLRNEGVVDNVYNVGNSVIDALQLGLSRIITKQAQYSTYFKNIDLSKRIVLVTCHRRESFGIKFRDVCQALLTLAGNNRDVEFVYVLHLNPNVYNVAKELLVGENIKFVDPLDYPHLIWILNRSYLVLTDSGGIQEEAPSLGKPVLVLRDVTERTEGVVAGTARLVGTDINAIVTQTQKLLDDNLEYKRMAEAVNPYGDGTTSQQIVDIVMSAASSLN